MTIWGSTDPLLRWLRVIAALAFLALVVLVVILPLLDPTMNDDLPLVALLSGAVLLQLGYEVVVPGLSRKGSSAKEPPREP